MNTEVIEWLYQAPIEVKQMFGNSVQVINFWNEERNRNFQMKGRYDGAISDEAKQLCQDWFDICDAIVEVSKNW